MLCPAILDPFEGSNYRLFAVVHQSMLCPLLCKLVSHFGVFKRYAPAATAVADVEPSAIASDGRQRHHHQQQQLMQHNANTNCDKTSKIKAIAGNVIDGTKIE